jgi:LysM repeat protein
VTSTDTQNSARRRRPRVPSTDALIAEIHFLRALSLLLFVVALVALLALRVGGCHGPARAIVVDNQVVCYVPDEAAAEKVRRRIIAQACGNISKDGWIEERWEVVRPKVVSVDEAVNLLQQRVHVQVEVVGIEVDGTVVLYLPSETMARQALELVKAHYSQGAERLLEPPKFREKIRIVPQTVRPENVILDVDKAAQLLVAQGSERIYTVQRGDHPSKIASKFGMTTRKLLDLNPNIKGRDLRVGESIKVASAKPAITVVTVRELQARKPIPPPEETVRTNSLPYGQKQVAREGEPGEKIVTLRAVFENDRRVKAQTVSERVIKEPVPRRVMIGTAPPQAPEQPSPPSSPSRQPPG